MLAERLAGLLLIEKPPGDPRQKVRQMPLDLIRSQLNSLRRVSCIVSVPLVFVVPKVVKVFRDQQARVADRRAS